MFVRYTGGGIGHLEQFPPADNSSEDAFANEGDVEAEVDDFIAGENDRSSDHYKEGEGKEDNSEDNGDEDGESEENEEEEDDPGESSDEETGNVY